MPMWLEHHKTMFDHGIIIDYWSTDDSVEICKRICPTWEVRTTRNSHFGAIEIDQEFMEIESHIEGIKMHLNTTEFLFADKPLTDMFDNTPRSIAVRAFGAYSPVEENPANLGELLHCVMQDNVVYRFEEDRGRRQMHTFPTGRYGLGRHFTYNPCIETDNMAILWLGYYPWNQRLIDRKLQIKTHIPDSDVKKGYSYHHFYELPKMLSIRHTWCNNGRKMQDVCPNLYRMVLSHIDKVSESGDTATLFVERSGVSIETTI